MNSDDSPKKMADERDGTLLDPLGRIVGDIVHIERDAQTRVPQAYVVSLARGLPRTLLSDVSNGVMRVEAKHVRASETGFALRVGLVDLREEWGRMAPVTLEHLGYDDEDEDAFASGFGVAEPPLDGFDHETFFSIVKENEKRSR